MAKRFNLAPVPTGEVSSYVSDPYNLSSIYMFGSSSPFTGSGNTIVRPSDDLLIAKGGNRAISVYQRLLCDEHVQASYSKLVQEITSRPWYIEEYSQKPGDIVVRDYVAEILEELPLDEVYRGLCEALIVGFSVGEIMWKKTKRGVIPYDIRSRDQRRFVFQENEESQTGFTMRCLTFNRMFEGIELPARKFIISRYWTYHNGDPYGSALGRVLYPLVKFRRRAIESYVLYGDRYATPTVVATAPLSASTAEIDRIYDLISNLSQETALVLPEGFKLDFIDPKGSPEVFKNLIDYIDKEISLLICGENEAGQAEAGSRASSQVANVVRTVKASEMSEIVSQLLTRTLIRWIVDLNFGLDVASPTIKREFRIEESSLMVSDVTMLMQSGFTPKREWVERHFRVDLEEEAPQFTAGGKPADPNAPIKYNAEEDQNLYESIFGPETSSGTPPEGEPVEGATEEEPVKEPETPEEEPEEEPVEGATEEAPEEEPETPEGEPEAPEEEPEGEPEEEPVKEPETPEEELEEAPEEEPEEPEEEPVEGATEEAPEEEPETPEEEPAIGEMSDDELIEEADRLINEPEEEPETPEGEPEAPEEEPEGEPEEEPETPEGEPETLEGEPEGEPVEEPETPEGEPEAPEEEPEGEPEEEPAQEKEAGAASGRGTPGAKPPSGKTGKRSKEDFGVQMTPPTDEEIDNLLNSTPED